jgi:hypothetical protein
MFELFYSALGAAFGVPATAHLSNKTSGILNAHASHILQRKCGEVLSHSSIHWIQPYWKRGLSYFFWSNPYTHHA